MSIEEITGILTNTRPDELVDDVHKQWWIDFETFLNNTQEFDPTKYYYLR